MTTITDRFSPEKPFSCAQGRHGELIIAQGDDVRPARWDGDPAVEAVDAGMDPPAAAPEIAVAETVHYYVARVDVTKPGACYYSPPTVGFGDTGESEGARAATALAYLSQASLSEIRVLDGGKYYDEPPAVTLGDSYGKFDTGNGLDAVLANPADPDPDNDPYTGIVEWAIISAPPAIAEDGSVDLLTVYAAFNGTYTLTTTPGSNTRNGSDRAPSYWQILKPDSSLTRTFPYTVANGQSSPQGSGAILKLTFGGSRWLSTTVSVGVPTDMRFRGATELLKVDVVKYGKGYSDDEPLVITIPASSNDAGHDIILEGYTANNSKAVKAARYPVKEVVLSTAGESPEDMGSGFLVAPQLKMASPSGFGAYATCTVSGGAIDTITLENGGGGYKTPPTVTVLSGGAEAFAISRPHLRGLYQCYSRFIDGTTADKGGPIPSNLSPVTEADTGEGATSITWTVPELPEAGRAVAVELWRTTSNEATTLYRVYSGADEEFVDDLTDDEVRDPDRAGYEAMPIILPNGELNANRFGIPPSDKSVVVRFQDRHWYASDTSGTQPNTILFSEIDEPESVPDVNELVLQQNSLDADSIQALVPFGAALLVLQSRHAYSLTFVKQPLLDAQVTPIAYRGVVNQRTWAIHSGVCYVLDESGLYSLDQSGAVAELASPVSDMFRTKLDPANRQWWFVAVDPRSEVVRAFVSFSEDQSEGWPTRALCYSIASKTWWMERYPQAISSSATVRLAGGSFGPIYAAEGGCYLLDTGAVDAGRGAVVAASLTNRGSGYRTPPAVTVAGGSGAELFATIDSSGQLSGIWIASTGYGYESGELTIGPPNDPDFEGGVQAEGAFVATPAGEDTSLHIPYRYKTGSAEYVADTEDPKAAMANPRNVRLLYQPQPSECVVALRMYYNNSPYPRGYLVARDRGAGFVSEPADAAARFDMGRSTAARGSDSGVASALFNGRLLDDLSSPDRNVAIELSGAATAGRPVVLYRLDVAGTADRQVQ